MSKKGILALIILGVLIIGFIMLYPYLGGGGETRPLPPLEIPKVYGFGIFTYEGQEIDVENPSAPQYQLPLNLEKIENIEQFSLSEKAKRKLSDNGFVVLPGKYTEIAEFYKEAKEHGKPIFITTDSVLFVYHAFFDTILMQLEEEQFIPILENLLAELVKEAENVYAQMPDDTLAKRSAFQNVAYLSVALKLLNPSFSPPGYVKSLVDKELNLIEKASDARYPSPIFSYNEDYTQYKPRGHYTKSEELKRYFKCMMWLGRMRFEAQDPLKPELAKIQTAQALQLTYLMVSIDIDDNKALVLWEKIYLPTSFIVGKSDDLSFYDYISIMKEVYPGFTPVDVNDEAKLQKFMNKIVELDKSKIVSSPIFPYEKSRLVGLRFMGQRFILDGYIHQQLCYPNLPTRLKVKGLDIMAVLGSERAMELLKEDFSKYPKFREKIIEVRNEISQLKPENWTETLYMGWLYSIQALLYEPSAGYPTFMTTSAWLDKSLSTALASWAQLRHDTILYAKQPYAGLTAVPPKQFHPGYVEPNPLLYSRLRNLVYATKKGLESLNLIDENMVEKLSSFAELLDGLANISVKELKGEKLNGEDIKLIKSYGYKLENLLSTAEPRAKDPRIIADVFTEPNSNTVLEVGTGYFDNIMVVYETPEGKLYIAIGLVMSYYEFYWPQTDRLTDEKWVQILESGKAPVQPDWIYNFKADPNVDTHSENIDILEISKSYRDFPSSTCYSGTRSYLFEIVPIAEGDINVVLARYWIWNPSPNAKCPEDLTIKIIAKEGEKEAFLPLEKEGMYCYTPLTLVIVNGQATVKIAKEAITIPGCWKNKNPWVYGRNPPAAILLSGRLNDLDWKEKKTENLTIEISRLYENSKIKIIALRITAFPISGSYFNVRIVEKGNTIGEFKIPTYIEDAYSKTNAVLMALPLSTTTLVIENERIEV